MNRNQRQDQQRAGEQGRFGRSFSGDSGPGEQRDFSQQRGPKGDARSDDRIKEDLCAQLMRQEEFELEDVSIEVKDGKVTLDGSVPERTMKHRIEDVACYCMGVKEVENRMRVSRDQPPRSSGEQGSTAGQQSRSRREH